MSHAVAAYHVPTVDVMRSAGEMTELGHEAEARGARP